MSSWHMYAPAWCAVVTREEGGCACGKVHQGPGMAVTCSAASHPGWAPRGPLVPRFACSALSERARVPPDPAGLRVGVRNAEMSGVTSVAHPV